MRVLVLASHLLHFRPLLPVIAELVHRGHTVTVKTTWPSLLGLPRWTMRHHPTRLTRINRSAIFSLESHIYACKLPARSLYWSMTATEADHDAVISTVKDLETLRAMTKPWVAVGYQHLPVVCTPSRWGTIIRDDTPRVFFDHPFATLHGFSRVLERCHVRPCGFPHLDGLRAPGVPSERRVLIVHPGGQRGVEGHAWLRRLVGVCREEGYSVVVSAHPVPGAGYEVDDLRRAVDGIEVVDGWYQAAPSCSLILTLGSSALYELWAVGYQNAYVLALGERAEKFTLFSDLMVAGEVSLRQLLRWAPRHYECESVTSEVAEAYRQVHDGNGTKVVCDVVEGK